MLSQGILSSAAVIHVSHQGAAFPQPLLWSSGLSEAHGCWRTLRPEEPGPLRPPNPLPCPSHIFPPHLFLMGTIFLGELSGE